jgi:DNA-binding response OmpR family regulator
MKKILLVDDEWDITNVIANVLKKNPIDVQAYNDPFQAILEFRAGEYDLIILDVQMRGMSGFDVYRELRRIDRNAKIIFLSGMTNLEYEFGKLFPEVRGQVFLRKPITMHQLTEQVREMIIAAPSM